MLFLIWYDDVHLSKFYISQFCEVQNLILSLGEYIWYRCWRVREWITNIYMYTQTSWRVKEEICSLVIYLFIYFLFDKSKNLHATRAPQFSII